MAATVRTLENFIGGRWVPATADDAVADDDYADAADAADDNDDYDKR